MEGIIGFGAGGAKDDVDNIGFLNNVLLLEVDDNEAVVDEPPPDDDICFDFKPENREVYHKKKAKKEKKNILQIKNVS